MVLNETMWRIYAYQFSYHTLQNCVMILITTTNEDSKHTICTATLERTQWRECVWTVQINYYILQCTFCSLLWRHNCCYILIEIAFFLASLSGRRPKLVVFCGKFLIDCNRKKVICTFFIACWSLWTGEREDICS